jgi:hypothetical protein
VDRRENRLQVKENLLLFFQSVALEIFYLNLVKEDDGNDEEQQDRAGGVLF